MVKQLLCTQISNGNENDETLGPRIKLNQGWSWQENRKKGDVSGYTLLMERERREGSVFCNTMVQVFPVCILLNYILPLFVLQRKAVQDEKMKFLKEHFMNITPFKERQGHLQLQQKGQPFVYAYNSLVLVVVFFCTGYLSVGIVLLFL